MENNTLVKTMYSRFVDHCTSGNSDVIGALYTYLADIGLDEDKLNIYIKEDYVTFKGIRCIREVLCINYDNSNNTEYPTNIEIQKDLKNYELIVTISLDDNNSESTIDIMNITSFVNFLIRTQHGENYEI